MVEQVVVAVIVMAIINKIVGRVDSSLEKKEKQALKRYEKYVESKGKLEDVYPFEVQTVPNKAHLCITPGCSAKGTIWIDLTKEAPNMVLAGTSGSGKSKLLKAILCQLIENYTPEELEIYYLDNKGGIEARAFRSVEHVKARTTNIMETIDELEKIQKEVLKRNRMIEKYDVTNIVELNKKRKQKLPFKLVVVDELFSFGTLPPKKKNEIYAKMAETASMCRSAGIHFIFSTQRPTADVLPTSITDNCDIRIGLRTSNKQGSHNIIEDSGLEHIGRLQKGRGIIKNEGLTPFQSFWIEEEVIKEICARHKCVVSIPERSKEIDLKPKTEVKSETIVAIVEKQIDTQSTGEVIRESTTTNVEVEEEEETTENVEVEEENWYSNLLIERN